MRDSDSDRYETLSEEDNQPHQIPEQQSTPKTYAAAVTNTNNQNQRPKRFESPYAPRYIQCQLPHNSAIGVDMIQPHQSYIQHGEQHRKWAAYIGLDPAIYPTKKIILSSTDKGVFDMKPTWEFLTVSKYKLATNTGVPKKYLSPLNVMIFPQPWEGPRAIDRTRQFVEEYPDVMRQLRIDMLLMIPTTIIPHRLLELLLKLCNVSPRLAESIAKLTSGGGAEVIVLTHRAQIIRTTSSVMEEEMTTEDITNEIPQAMILLSVGHEAKLGRYYLDGNVHEASKKKEEDIPERLRHIPQIVSDHVHIWCRVKRTEVEIATKKTWPESAKTFLAMAGIDALPVTTKRYYNRDDWIGEVITPKDKGNALLALSDPTTVQFDFLQPAQKAHTFVWWVKPPTDKENVMKEFTKGIKQQKKLHLTRCLSNTTMRDLGSEMFQYFHRDHSGSGIPLPK